MEIQIAEKTITSDLVQKVWNLICLISANNADREFLLATILTEVKNQKRLPSNSDLSLAARKLVLKKSQEISLSEFKTRLKLPMTDLAIEVFYYTFIKLMPINQIVPLIGLEYQSVCQQLRQAMLTIRGQGNFIG